MRYLEFNSLWTVCCVGMLLEFEHPEIGLLSTTDLAKCFGLPWAFRYNAKKDSFYAGGSCQGKDIWTPGLEMLGFSFDEIKTSLPEAVRWLKTHPKMMVSFSSENGRYGLVLSKVEDGIFYFLNPHYKDDDKPDIIKYTEAELFNALPDVCILGYLVNSTFLTEKLPNSFFQTSIDDLEIYLKKFVEFCGIKHTKEEIIAKKEAYFKPLTTDQYCFKELYNENVRELLDEFRNECLELFSLDECIPERVINLGKFMLLLSAIKKEIHAKII